MSKFTTFINLMKNKPQDISRILDSKLSKLCIMRCVPDRIFLEIRYVLCVHKRLNLKKPDSFNEKLQWLKLYYRDSQYITLADKYEVKEFVKHNYPDINVIPTIGIWEKVEDIDFQTLPEQYVLKCTHDTGSTIICKDKDRFNILEAKKKLNISLKKNMFYQGREWVYKSIKPRIIAENYYHDDSSEELKDYKFMCFNGKVKCSFVCSDRFSPEGLHVTFFDRNWNVMPFTRHYPMRKEGIPKPVCYEKMVTMAEKMSIGMPFVRIDFYEINHEIYFGEYTFFPGSGFEEFDPIDWDYTLGNWIILPNRK